MKKRILAAVIAGVMIASTVCSTGQVVSAAPTDVNEARTQYEELKAKVDEYNTQIQELDAQINPLQDKINSNKAQIETINKEIEDTKKDIEEAKVEIEEKEQVLGTRLREVYKSGGQVSYISLLFSADSFSDLITKLDSANRIIKIDQDVVTDLTDNKDKLDSDVKALETKANDIVSLNQQIEEEKSKLDDKRAEQDSVKQEAEAQQKEFDSKYLSEAEREVVASYMSICKDSSKSADELRSAVSMLRSIRDGQLKSPTVIEEVNSAIETAKSTISSKEAAANNVNRGNGVTVSGDASGLVSFAMGYLGSPYVWGATGPSSFDCSGFTSFVYRNVLGINIGRTTYDQINVGRSVSRSELQPGDLVFPHSGHVGIYVGNGNMIHAPQSGDVVKVSSVYSFWQARRVVG